MVYAPPPFSPEFPDPLTRSSKCSATSSIKVVLFYRTQCCAERNDQFLLKGSLLCKSAEDCVRSCNCRLQQQHNSQVGSRVAIDLRDVAAVVHQFCNPHRRPQRSLSPN